MNRQKLDIIDFKNRIWLFFILIPIGFGLFFFTFSVSFLLPTNESTIGFYMTFIVFLLEIQLITIIFSRFRYVPNGQLNFNENGVFISNSSDSFNLSWGKIKDIKYYYRGDRFWRLKLGGIILNRGRRRYYNLHWMGKKDLDERIIDRIDFNGVTKYVKIRNENEKNIFMDLISLSKKKGCNVKIMETDFTTTLFGKVIDI